MCSGHLSTIKHAAFNMAIKKLVAFFFGRCGGLGLRQPIYLDIYI